MSPDAIERAVAKIAKLSAGPHDLVTLWRSATDVLGSVVPYYWTPCWYTLDPASLLITSHFHFGMTEFPAEWLVVEYYEEDVNKLADVVRSEAGLATLHEATGGDPTSSPRWHRAREQGSDQELIVRLRARNGENWGALGLYREPGSPMFDAGEKRFIQAITPLLADGARRALLLGEASDPEFADSPGLLILDRDLTVESATPGIEGWLSRLAESDSPARGLPSAVLALAGRALAISEDAARPGEIAVSRVRLREGGWVVLHGACLTTTGDRRVAIIIEPAHPDRLYPLLMAAYGLTEREKEVTRLVLQGLSTAEIAAQLVVTGHTVQQHLKSVFDKTGVRSRRDLVGHVFFSHYEPRFRDNEKRVLTGKPPRGGPWEPARGSTHPLAGPSR
jgi:DNA-binding CsgD family transcriptional regulator